MLCDEFQYTMGYHSCRRMASTRLLPSCITTHEHDSARPGEPCVVLNTSSELITIDCANGASYGTRNQHRSNEHPVCRDFVELPGESREEMLGRLIRNLMHHGNASAILDICEGLLWPLGARLQDDHATGRLVEGRIRYVDFS